MTVLEPLRCPGCSTRFLLGAARVKPATRRAKCFRCGTIFPIQESVARLLAPEQPGRLDLAETLAPSLTPEDLQGVPEEPTPAGAQPAPGASYASARDAIEQLMGTAPAPTAPVRMGGRSAMDVEATLDALSSTLGEAPAPVTASTPASAPEPIPEALPAAAPQSDLSSTVKLTSEEIKNAMASMGDPARSAAPVAPPRPAIPAPADNPPLALVDPALAQGADLLKIQLEQETCQNVTIEQMTAWIEQGRVLEYHMVARQFSEHWIEAGKVPALRPVFDRMRKIREVQAEEPPKPPEPPPVKRGLFSGLFGRN
jgi:predicted Zn finger-like uncharacterized protein